MIRQSKRKKVGKAFFAFVILFLIAGIMGCQKIDKSNDLEDQQKDNSAKVGDAKSNNPALDFKLKLTDGKEIKLSDKRGKIVIIDFWATWCPPCRRSIPDLIDIQNKYENKVVIIGISLDRDTKPDVVPFIKEYGINYPVAYGTTEVVEAFGDIEAIPTSFIIDKSGRIVDKQIGLVDKSIYINKINELLKKS
jgi:cytochrome c biogenesis protein CcmG/thiol:disulfide interchange protein DsbE